ncbi:MAG: tRNA uracil 4-sulfurtransferase ThiI, partial [Bacillota bacterium]
YANGTKIKLHLVPFRELHELILKEVDEPYIITIMRRMMYRIADKIAKANNHKAIISGDSIGQVASQTLESLITAQDVVSTLIIRPLSTYDKSDIISLARKIDTLDISNRAFSDCCTVYVPKNPVIKPTVKRAESIEEKIAYEEVLLKIYQDTINIVINARKKYNIIDKGFTVKEALNEEIRNQ